MKNKIQVFITGGTFDKEYDYITGQLFFKNTHLPNMLKRGRCTVDYDIKTLMMLDSLQMSDEHRSLILKECEESDYRRVLLTHGTDTMVKTANFLATHLKNKTIVITGAMIPYAFGDSSDGFFNLGSALAFCQILDPGVYISMNGKVFNHDKVEKNYETGYFERI